MTYKNLGLQLSDPESRRGCGAEPRKVTGGVESPVERYQPYNREG